MHHNFGLFDRLGFLPTNRVGPRLESIIISLNTGWTEVFAVNSQLFPSSMTHVVECTQTERKDTNFHATSQHIFWILDNSRHQRAVGVSYSMAAMSYRYNNGISSGSLLSYAVRISDRTEGWIENQTAFINVFNTPLCEYKSTAEYGLPANGLEFSSCGLCFEYLLMCSSFTGAGFLEFTAYSYSSIFSIQLCAMVELKSLLFSSSSISRHETDDSIHTNCILIVSGFVAKIALFRTPDGLRIEDALCINIKMDLYVTSRIVDWINQTTSQKISGKANSSGDMQ